MRRKKAGKSIELADESGEIVGLTTDPDKIRAGRYNRATQKRRASKTWTPYPASAEALGLQSEEFRHEVRIGQELSWRSGARGS